jgi:hypothetical protein
VASAGGAALVPLLPADWPAGWTDEETFESSVMARQCLRRAREASSVFESNYGSLGKGTLASTHFRFVRKGNKFFSPLRAESRRTLLPCVRLGLAASRLPSHQGPSIPTDGSDRSFCFCRSAASERCFCVCNSQSLFTRSRLGEHTDRRGW